MACTQDVALITYRPTSAPNMVDIVPLHRNNYNTRIMEVNITDNP